MIPPRLLILLTILTSSACGAPAFAPQRSSHLNVFAASSLTEAFEQLGKTFEATHPGLSISFNFAGSQALRTQIEQGAPADVFASASPDDMGMLEAEGFVSSAASEILVTNKLVVILPPGNPAGLKALNDLAKPGIKVVLAAEDVPVGAYARQSLDRMDLSFGNDFNARVLANVVSNEDNVKQVVAKVQLSEADAGIVYTSDAVAAPNLLTLDIPAQWNIVAQYPVAVLRQAPNADTAAEFVNYVLGSDAQAVLHNWGFDSAR